jgi:hypothetical protein
MGRYVDSDVIPAFIEGGDVNTRSGTRRGTPASRGSRPGECGPAMGLFLHRPKKVKPATGVGGDPGIVVMVGDSGLYCELLRGKSHFRKCVLLTTQFAGALD